MAFLALLGGVADLHFVFYELFCQFLIFGHEYGLCDFHVHQNVIVKVANFFESGIREKMVVFYFLFDNTGEAVVYYIAHMFEIGGVL